MNCPQCKGYRLEPKELEPGLIVGTCKKCEGALVSLMHYRYWADLQNDDLKETVEEEIVETQDNSTAMVCPKCSKLMTKFQIGASATNRLDLCASCDEAWLDKGEWRLLKQLDLADKLPRIFTDAWQKNIRLERRTTIHKQRYKALLGEDDFNKLDSFKGWLDSHPEKAKITQYLITSIE